MNQTISINDDAAEFWFRQFTTATVVGSWTINVWLDPDKIVVSAQGKVQRAKCYDWSTIGEEGGLIDEAAPKAAQQFLRDFASNS